MDACGATRRDAMPTARAGTISNFAGIDSAYEAPLEPELVLRTRRDTADHHIARTIEHLRSNGYVG